MTKLPDGIGRKPSAGERNEGNPGFPKWLWHKSFGAKVRAPIWEATAGLADCIKGDLYEYCLTFARVTNEGASTAAFAGAATAAALRPVTTKLVIAATSSRKAFAESPRPSPAY